MKHFPCLRAVVGRLTFLGISFLALQSSVYAAKITIACGVVADDFGICKKNAQAWAKETGNTVKMFETPTSSHNKLEIFQQFFAGKSQEIDVLQADVVWTGLLGKHFVDLRDYLPAEILTEHFKGVIENNTDRNGRVVAMPYFVDAGVLYYRKDLLTKYGYTFPKTWAGLKSMALDVLKKEKKSNPRLQGFVWQGKAAEALTCNAFEWINSFNGGTIVDAKTGEVTVNNPNALLALKEAASWIDTISPRSVLSFDKEDARKMFQEGNAIFMRNWPYAWALLSAEDSPVKGKVGVTALPIGGEHGLHSATLGGWNLSVSKYSKHPKESADLVRFMTSKKIQLERAIQASYNPSIQELYKNPELINSKAIYKDLYDAFLGAVPRPSKVTDKSYSKVSNKFWVTIHSVLAGDEKPEKALEQLEKDLNNLKGSGW